MSEPVPGGSPAPLAGKVAFITGSGSGLGRAMAPLFAARGASVAVTDLPDRLDQAQAVVDEITAAEAGSGRAAPSRSASSPRAVPIALDVRDAASIHAAVAATVDAFGRLDIAVCNAGINIRKPALDVTEADWDAVLAVNLRGVFFTAQAAARQMVAQGGGGKIVSIASIFGLVGGTDRAAYSASKAGVVNLTRSLAIEWAPHRIQVNAVAPTFVITPLTERIFANPAVLQAALAGTPNRQLATPEAVAEAVLYLASPAADLITGVTLPVDGGWTAQ